jgi:undecaprenyl-diphosphatase
MLFRKWAAGVFLLAVTGTSFGLNVLIKYTTDRPRPPWAYRLINQGGPGYPSAHAMVNTTAWLAIALLLSRQVSSRKHRVLILAVGLLGPAAIGTSRIYLGVHWATDVLGGWALGIAWTLMGWLVLELCVRHKCTTTD